MPDNDSSYTYQKNMLGDRQPKASLQALITLERAQKLDLLIHLISNLSQSLVICGSQGIGKTRLVETLLEHNRDHWPICIVQGSAGLSFEAILEQFAQQLIRQEAVFAGQDLSAILQHYQKNNAHVVLIVDDAGLLVPGLITALIQYANSNEAIRLVLTLTHDELHIKHSSDSIIDECHFIEMPPLNKKQCMTFLQNLSAQPGAAISFNAVTDGLVDNLYSATHGIPGRILAELPRLSEYQSKAGIKWGVIAVVLIGLSLIGGGVYFNEHDPREDDGLVASRIGSKPAPVNIPGPVVATNKPVIETISEQSDKSRLEHLSPAASRREITQSLFKAEKSDVDIEPPVVEDSPIQGNEIVADAEDKVAAQTEAKQAADINEETALEIEQGAESAGKNESPAEEPKTMAAKQIAKETEEKTPIVMPSAEEKKPADDGAHWVSAQNASQYTLQLMVLSRKQSVIDLLKKHPGYQQAIKYFNIGKSGQDKYVLVYGAFTSSNEAERAKKTLPPVFKNAWVRKFKVLQKQVKSN
ncbi:AAA family ATPase [Methylomarinum vadi]|uniref:AAA family ATPase n=1 Tax=Methylomarinum vadi TaxID=438855 RepID=UPI0004DFA506|nr:AAA family ATPase [Methylomarinum vadi]